MNPKDKPDPSISVEDVLANIDISTKSSPMGEPPPADPVENIDNPFKGYGRDIDTIPDTPDFDEPPKSRITNSENKAKYKRAKKTEENLQKQAPGMKVTVEPEFASTKTTQDYAAQIRALEKAIREPDLVIANKQYGAFQTAIGVDLVVPNDWRLQFNDRAKKLLSRMRDIGFNHKTLPTYTKYSQVYEYIRQCHIERKYAKPSKANSVKLEFSVAVTDEGQVYIDGKRMEIVMRNRKPNIRAGVKGNYSFKSVDSIRDFISIINKLGHKS